MIDYSLIRESCPKALDEFIEFSKPLSIDSNSESPRLYIIPVTGSLHWGIKEISVSFNNRDLYDFFDNNGLYCGCILDEYGMIFFIRVVQNGSTKNVNTINGEDRHEAESAGFTKAFEILEERLTLK